MAYGKIKADALIHDNGGSDVETSISDLAAKAALASPTFTGTPAAPTAAQGTSTTQIATTAFVNAEIAADTAAKAPLADPTFTGVPAAPTASAGTNTTQIATTAFVTAAIDPDTAKTDVAQTYTAGQRGEVTSFSSSSGTAQVDCNDSNNFAITLSENITTFNIANPTAGQSGSIFISQPSSGGPYTVGGWNAVFKFAGAVAPTITATNSKTDRIDYVVKSATEVQVVWTGNY